MSAAGRAVLVVDDEEDMGWAMRHVLELEGCRPVVARSGGDALGVLHAEPFALVFADLKLPDMEGLELVRRINEARPGLPCVLVSGYLYGDDESVQAALAAGRIVAFIGKPFDLSQVRAVLGKAEEV